MEICNKTKGPLAIPLPGGKKLRIGPGKTGQIAPKAANHPPVKALIDSGELEVLDAGLTKGRTGFGNTGLRSSGDGPSTTGGVRHTGDR